MIGWVGLIYAHPLPYFSWLFLIPPFPWRLLFVWRYFLFSWGILWVCFAVHRVSLGLKFLIRCPVLVVEC